MIIFLLLVLVVAYIFFKQVFAIVCGVVGLLLAIIIWLLLNRRRK